MQRAFCQTVTKPLPSTAVLHEGGTLADIATVEIQVNRGLDPRKLAVKPDCLKPEMR